MDQIVTSREGLSSDGTVSIDKPAPEGSEPRVRSTTGIGVERKFDMITLYSVRNLGA